MGDKKNFVNSLQVQSTNDASIVSKCSMAKCNYVKDDFVKYFVEREKSRASLIHLGYCTRFVIISEILIRFIRFLQYRKIIKFQIISCGAGFDTTYWRLSQNNLLNQHSNYIEIDYPDVINRKLTLINRSEKLLKYLNIEKTDKETNEKLTKLNDNYHFLRADLRDLETIENLLREISVDFNVPTLFLSECVITYMKKCDSDKLLKWITEKFPNCGFVNYEQIHPEDGFGSIMMKHFEKLQSSLHSVIAYPNCCSHRTRYQSTGFESTVVMSEWDFFLYLTDSEERRRMLTLEQFDEFEEFHLKCNHYIVAISANNILKPFLSEFNFPCDYMSEDCKSFRIEDKSESLNLFGHATCESLGKILIFGGFGLAGRSKKVLTYNNGRIGEMNVTNTGGETFRLDFVHGCVTSFSLNGKNYVGLYGGRTSPNTVSNSGNFIILEHVPDNLFVRGNLPCEGGPTPRYRSSMVCRTSGSNELSAWIFGGRTPDLRESLSDFWRLLIHPNGDNFKFEWMKVEKELAPPGRMSHSAVVDAEENAMYLTGGLDTRDFTVLGDIWKWCFATETWEEIKPKNGEMIPRYGHNSHIRGRILYLIGGVNTKAGRQPGLTLFDLDALHITEYSLEVFRREPLLLFNHSSTIVEDYEGSGSAFIFGGGGNCFSFGTHFNKGIHIVSLKQ